MTFWYFSDVSEMQVRCDTVCIDMVLWCSDGVVCILVSEVKGKWRSPRNREIGFVSFVRASVRASEAACAR